MKKLTKSREYREISDINGPRGDDDDKTSKLEKRFEAEVPHRHNTSLSDRQNDEKIGKKRKTPETAHWVVPSGLQPFERASRSALQLAHLQEVEDARWLASGT